jgi:hypothetical protein
VDCRLNWQRPYGPVFAQGYVLVQAIVSVTFRGFSGSRRAIDIPSSRARSIWLSAPSISFGESSLMQFQSLLAKRYLYRYQRAVIAGYWTSPCSTTLSTVTWTIGIAFTVSTAANLSKAAPVPRELDRGWRLVQFLGTKQAASLIDHLTLLKLVLRLFHKECIQGLRSLHVQ